ncbi:MAG TPA: glutaredoxin domain-containing protein [Actinomycetota bacterium]|jgi:glutaredoxin
MSEITMYGADWCGDCRRAKGLLEALDVPYRYIDVEHDAAMTDAARRIGGSRRIPVIVLSDGSVLVEPSNQDLQEALHRTGSLSPA